jgi:hypothetical protein
MKQWSQRGSTQVYQARYHTPMKPSVVDYILDYFHCNPSGAVAEKQAQVGF